MGGGGVGEVPPADKKEGVGAGASPMKNRKKPRLPTARAMEILTDFRMAETRNLEIDAKLLKARSLRMHRVGSASGYFGSQQLASSAASLPASPTRGGSVSPGPGPGSPLHAATWSHSDPREPSLSTKLIEKGIAARIEFQKAQFVKDLERERAQEEWRARRALERDLQAMERAKARTARAKAVMQAALDKQSSRKLDAATKHVSAMQRSQKVLEQNTMQVEKKIDSIRVLEQTRLKQAQEKVELHTLKHTEAKAKEWDQNEKKRTAEGFRQQSMESRQRMLAERKSKEAQKAARVQELRECDAEARRAALAAKLARIEQNQQKKNQLILEKSLKVHTEVVQKLTAAEARYCQQMSAHDSKRALWKSKESGHIQSYLQRKEADAARKEELVQRERQELILRDEIEDLALKAVNTKQMPQAVLIQAMAA